MARHKDGDWTLPEKVQNWEQVNSAILMDIRDELKRLNLLLHCHNTRAIPDILRAIQKNTTKPKRRPKP